MSELLHTPYKPCFEDIERRAKQEGLTPGTAYELYDNFLVEHNLDPTIYLSMAITSGGYKRDPELSVGEVVQFNSEFGTHAASALIRQFPVLEPADIVVPSELGKVAGWSQADYLLFWAHTILGATPNAALEIEQKMQQAGMLELPGFNNPDLDQQTRWFDYVNFINTYAHRLGDIMRGNLGMWSELKPNNMQAAIFILDHELSLGARAEEQLCRRLGIPPQVQILDSSVFVASDESFRVHVGELKKLGAAALGTQLNYQPVFTHVGISKSGFDTDIAFNAGMRKTGLMNALFAKEWYADHPGTRPARHQGHTPLVTSEPTHS
jgi:hypothetical protein